MTEHFRRRSVYVRTGELPPLQMNDRDKKVLEVVADLQIATAEQIHRMVFAPSCMRACTRRLQKLWLHRYLERLFPSFIFREGSAPREEDGRIYYQLGPKASEVVQVSGAILSKAKRMPRPLSLGHTHDVNEFRSALTAALATHAGREHRLTWTGEHVLRERVRTARQKNPALRRSPALVFADAMFSFMDPTGRRQYFFLEIDRGTESIWRLVQRAKGYVRLHHSDLKTEVHGVPGFRVLIVTRSLDRLMHLRARIAAIGDCHNMFWFTTFEEKTPDGAAVSNLTPERMLRPIWHKITDSDRHSLLECRRRREPGEADCADLNKNFQPPAGAEAPAFQSESGPVQPNSAVAPERGNDT